MNARHVSYARHFHKKLSFEFRLSSQPSISMSFGVWAEFLHVVHYKGPDKLEESDIDEADYLLVLGGIEAGSVNTKCFPANPNDLIKPAADFLSVATINECIVS